MSETTTPDAVLARLEALEAEIAGLKAENARLRAARTADVPSRPQPGDVSLPAGRRSSGAGLLRRRGVLAGAAALVGAGLARLGATGDAEAAHEFPAPSDETIVHAGANNTTTATTTIQASPIDQPALVGRHSAGFVRATHDGVQGITGSTSVQSAGVRGIADGATGRTYGVDGRTSSNETGAAGIRGSADGDGAIGVLGQHLGGGAGVRGEILEPSSNTGSGVVGVAAGCEFSNQSNVGVGGSGRGLSAVQNKTGVLGTTDGGIGVQGWAMGPGTGIRGLSNFGGGPDFGGSGIGVEGRSGTGTGVYGESTSSIGVHGKSTNNAGVFAQGPIGVYAAGTGVAGVFGGSNGNGFGFWGNSAASAGVYGTSTTGPGVRAESTNQYGLYAKGPTYAGVFEGNIFVTGRVTALGGVGASTATATTRTLAEDVGEAMLTNGKATVALDPAFAEEVKGGRYQVFVTPNDASGRGLAVVARRRDGFDVQELAGGATDGPPAPGRGGSAGFSYRVVAKLTGPRQAPLAPPDLTTIKPAPPLPEPPKAPEPSGASQERRER